MGGSEEELKNLLMKVKEESKKAGLKLSIQKNEGHCIWSVETMTDFIFLGPKITADGDWSSDVCPISSPAFLMMYSAYKLNKQGDNIQP